MNSTRLRVSGRRKMSETVYATGMPFAGRGNLPAALQDLARLMPQCAGVRRWGAASLDLAYVAAGRYDGFWERDLQPWDIAAGIILVREAGGLLEPLQEGGDIMESGSLICANEPMFAPLCKVIRNN